ncbi:hypothetical protein MTO96_040255, partial [Rhipicephalus appendiculatus]
NLSSPVYAPLLLDALEGISFLSDEVSQIREQNERLRKDHSRGVEQQARVVGSLRGGDDEVRFLRDVLIEPHGHRASEGSCGPKARENADRSAISKPPAYSGQPL